MADIIKTPSFKLAVYRRGNEQAEKLAIVIPGRLDTKDYPHIKSLVDFLSEHGYCAISFDPPGTWESPGDISLYTTTNYIKVIKELVEMYGNKPTFLIGHSRGGSVSMLAGPTIPSLLGIGLIMANYGPPTPPREEAKQLGYQVSHRPKPNDFSQEIEFHLSMDYFRDGQRYDPLNSLKTISQPKFIVYGSQDEFTKPSFVKSLYNELIGEKELYELNYTHDYFVSPEMVKQINVFLDKFLENMNL